MRRQERHRRCAWTRARHLPGPSSRECCEENGEEKCTQDAGFPVDVDDEENTPADIIDKSVGEASCLLFEGEAIPGGFATKLWAFMSLSGDRVMCVMTETESNAVSLHLKADNRFLMYALVGSKESRKAIVAALTTGLTAEG